MTGHLSPENLAALADGELHAQHLTEVQHHLAGCATCTSHALAHALLKSATGRAGQRYAVPAELAGHISRELAQAALLPGLPAPPRPGDVIRKAGWAVAASVLLLAAASATWFLARRDFDAKETRALAAGALVSEAFDEHVAALASAAPQVLSSDNHTVKPWFQGKLPFAFNLPDTLPDGMTLDGANFGYLRNQPAAQLLFSIGRHRVSVFVTRRTRDDGPGGLQPATTEDLPQQEHAGFHVMGFASGELEGIAVSDVNPERLAELIRAIKAAQTRSGP